MKTFLEYVAEDIIRKYGSNLAHTAVIFPNKRARLFFNEYLAKAVNGPMWSPAYLTISELFRKHSDKVVADPIKLVCDLHKTFVEVTGMTESLDHFYSWGQIMLADFDDIDKNMADASLVFKNVRDIHELDDITYLTTEQKEMLKHFFTNFSDDKQSELKKRFLSLWQHFHDIYLSFNRRLADNNEAYEGALYREVASNDDIDFGYERYIFVGFNLLQTVEQRVFSRLKKEGRAVFYWDFDKYYMSINGIQNEAGHYISKYLSEYPNALDSDNDYIYGNFNKPKKITYISAPTENVQASYSRQWLEQDNRLDGGRETAIVLCNEQLLQAIVHNIPDKAEKVNITTGYPLAQSPFCSLLTMIISLRNEGLRKSNASFKLRYVNRLLKHPYISYITANSKELLEEINGENRQYFVRPDVLSRDEGTRTLFTIPADNTLPSSASLLRWLSDILCIVASNAKETDDNFFHESLFRVFTIVNRLLGLVNSGDLTVDVKTMQRLLSQIIQTSSIPFHGEPAEGIQYMGVLETRNLDFKHLLLLSCNEGNMPKGVNDTSFIPYSIRKANGLTTIDNKVAIYAYYFYRLMQRAEDITIVYNSTADLTSTGEMSRFMLQMLIESNHCICRKTIVSGAVSMKRKPAEIEKNAKVMDILRKRFDIQYNPKSKRPLLTPTSIATYCRCQLRYYYTYVLGLRDIKDKEEETIDNVAFGNVFHHSAEEIYKRMLNNGNVLSQQAFDEVLKSKNYILGIVQKMFDEVVYNVKNHQYRPEYNGLELINIRVIVSYIEQLLRIDRDMAPIKIKSLEMTVKESIEVRMGDTGQKFQSTIGGDIDRLDELTDKNGYRRIRVVDYKTGSSKMNASLKDVGEIFEPMKISSHSDYYMQTIIYSNIVRHSSQLNDKDLPVSPALLFIQHANTNPILLLDKKPIVDVKDIEVDFRKGLSNLLAEMFDPALTFKPTEDPKRCENCPYKKMCGK